MIPFMTNNDFETELLTILKEFLSQLDAQRAIQSIRIDASLERELGIDSLGKVELFHRIEKRFHLQLPERAMATADSLQDLVQYIQLEQVHFSQQKIQQTVSPPLKPLSHPLKTLSLDPSGTSTLLDVIHLYGLNESERPHIYYQNEYGIEKIIHYGTLFKEAEKVALGLQERNIQSGETIAIMLPTGPDFFYAFCGTLLAGSIPVPIYPPFRPDQIEEYIKREAKILNNAEVRILITFEQANRLSNLLHHFIPSLKEVTTLSDLQMNKSIFKNKSLELNEVSTIRDFQTSNTIQLNKTIQSNKTILENRPIESNEVTTTRDLKTIKTIQTNNSILENRSVKSTDGALIQYTSGSTGDPKGVYLTHANILANIRAIGAAIPIKPTDTAVSWLPLYHDMGLMTWLASLYFGIPVTIMSPMTFLSRPEKWLWAIHYHRAALSGGPNFAYELCAKKINPNDIQGLDLSSWRFAFNGAESINPKTLKRFSSAFAPFGFKSDMFAPVYGLAESTVALTFPKTTRPPRIDTILRAPFQLENKAIQAPANSDKNSMEWVACGEPILGHAIRIVNDHGSVLPERIVGNLQFKGPSSMQGYFNNAKATQKIFHNGWWETGDLAYIADHDLFITGRKKDIIIKAGRNIYPEEIEEIVSHVPSVRKGCIIAFGILDEQTGTEKIVIAAETYESDKNKQQSIRAAIIEKMAIELNIPPDIIVLVPIRTIPKTSSGKLRRSVCKELYLRGKLTRQKLPAQLQLIKLILMNAKNKFIQSIRYALTIVYAMYIALILIGTFPFLYLGILFSSRHSAAIIIKHWARNFLRLSGCRVYVTGHENLSKKENGLFVANHASYIDALLLIGILPAGVIFTVKQELTHSFFLRFFIKKLGYITINRQDVTKSLEDTKLISAAAKRHESIVIFPEGTFTYATGLRPFKLGAFTIAAETRTPISPIAIQGTRSILRGDSLLPTPGKIVVSIGQPIYPKENTWAEILRLHALVRTEIATHCGEPAIDMVTTSLRSREKEEK
jgi:fatty-acyl-CoA synthase